VGLLLLIASMALVMIANRRETRGSGFSSDSSAASAAMLIEEKPAVAGFLLIAQLVERGIVAIMCYIQSSPSRWFDSGSEDMLVKSQPFMTW